MTITTLEMPCLVCDGEGAKECCECGQDADCNACDGTGTTTCEIGKFDVPARHRSRDELLAIQDDAKRAVSDHAKLVALNPRYASSYDDQLRQTLGKLTDLAKSLL